MILTVSQRLKLIVENSIITVSKLVEKATVRKKKNAHILIQLNSFRGWTNIETKHIELFSVRFLIEHDPKKSKSKILSQGLKKIKLKIKIK